MARTLMDHPTSTAMRVALTRTRPALAAPLVPRSSAAGGSAAALSCEQPRDEARLPAVRPTWLLALMRTGAAHGVPLAPEEGAKGPISCAQAARHTKRQDSTNDTCTTGAFLIGMSSREDRL